MANWSTIDYPPLPHNPTRRPLTHPSRPLTQPTRPVTHPEPNPSVLGNPPAHFGGGPSRGRSGGPRGRGRGRGRGSYRGGFRGPSTVNEPNLGTMCDHNVGDLSEKFDELEVIEESVQLAKNINDDFKNNNKNIRVVNDNVDVNDDNNGVNDKVKYDDNNDEIPVEASGQNVPKPVTKFEEMTELGFALHENIKRCKYVKPTPIQRHAIPILVAGRDLMACAQTGSGKTAAFCFPIIAGILKKNALSSAHGSGGGNGSGGFRGCGRAACPVALIMSPTRELSSQIHDEAKKFANQTGVRVVVAYGGTPMSEQLHKLSRGVDILVATPGRLVDMIGRGRVSLRMVRYFVLDEADRMLDMGFEPQIRKIAEQMDMPRPGSRQTMLFSATFPTEIQRLASDFLANYIFLTVGKVGSSNDMIEQKVELVNDYDKKNHLKDLLIAQSGTDGKLGLTIVFAETKRAVDALAQWLSYSGFPATAIHGDKVQTERERALKSFKRGETPIIVATDVAARGLDIPCVAHVINYDLPRDIEHYVHRIGRTGRAGKSGLATAFFCDKDTPIAKSLAELMEEANQTVPQWLTEYAHSSSSYGYGGGNVGGCRSNCSGKFGSRDYRSFDKPNFSNSYTDNYSNTYTENYTSSYTDVPKPAYTQGYTSNYTDEVSKAAYTEDYTSTYVDEVPKTDSFRDGSVDPYTSPAHGSTHGYETIVATGWD